MSSPPAVPYQAYKPKRHSQTLSTHLNPNQSPPPVTRPSNGADTLLQLPRLALDRQDMEVREQPTISQVPKELPKPLVTNPTPGPSTSELRSSLSSPQSSIRSFDLTPSKNHIPPTLQPSQAPEASFPGQSSARAAAKKPSTFRRLQPKNHRSRQSVGHSPRDSDSFLTPVDPDKGVNNDINSDVTLSPIPHNLIVPLDSKQPESSPQVSTIIEPVLDRSISNQSQQSASYITHTSFRNDSSLVRTTSSSTTPENDATISDKSTRSTPLPRKHAPYRPGFQPKGIYRPLTDEFIAIRRTFREGEGEGGMKRVERTKLERRLEKLIALHFPYHTSVDGSKERLDPELRPNLAPNGRDKRRSSSFFDFQTLRNLNINDAGDLWRGVVSVGLGDSTKSDIRAAEQRITPWQDDAVVSKCPLCSAPFHTLTNRKHHCRLCGQIICSLPIKHPQRRTLCSTLFVVDTETRQIEEVGEGVDYGVRRRKDSLVSQQGKQEEEDKFLKGIRICHECRPILLKQQYYQQSRTVPPFFKLYEACSPISLPKYWPYTYVPRQHLIILESDIEESLPKFQELLMSLSHDDQPTKEASAARKRLLDSFAQYDKLSKKIRGLSCPNGPGSSQDRVQAAILTRANLFLQKNMFPLQSLPTPQPKGKVIGLSTSQNGEDVVDASHMSVDVDADLALILQPLLEQEALLESFVEEARSQRKFEDVKTLKVNLVEIRQEIERLLQGKP